MTVDDLVASISQNGDAARTLCQQYLLAQNHGEVDRKLLRGVNNLRTSMGEALFRKVYDRSGLSDNDVRGPGYYEDLIETRAEKWHDEKGIQHDRT